jgi:hypothetical protein
MALSKLSPFFQISAAYTNKADSLSYITPKSVSSRMFQVSSPPCFCSREGVGFQGGGQGGGAFQDGGGYHHINAFGGACWRRRLDSTRRSRSSVLTHRPTLTLGGVVLVERRPILDIVAVAKW